MTDITQPPISNLCYTIIAESVSEVALDHLISYSRSYSFRAGAFFPPERSFGGDSLVGTSLVTLTGSYSSPVGLWPGKGREREGKYFL